MNITIHPFVAGVLTVIGVEFVALFIAGCVMVKREKHKRKNGKNRKE